MKTASWVIYGRDGKPLFETFNEKLVKALNTKRYEAVPILQHLVSLNVHKD
jgi:hypothetical protein